MHEHAHTIGAVRGERGQVLAEAPPAALVDDAGEQLLELVDDDDQAGVLVEALHDGHGRGREHPGIGAALVDRLGREQQRCVVGREQCGEEATRGVSAGFHDDRTPVAQVADRRDLETGDEAGLHEGRLARTARPHHRDQPGARHSSTRASMSASRPKNRSASSAE